MRWVIPQRLAQGNAGDTRDLVALRRAGVEALVDLAMSERPLAVPREMTYCRFPLVDGPGNGKALIRSAIEATVSLVRGGVPTLVFCSAGMSRSPAVAAAVMAIVSGRTPAACLEEIVPGGGVDVSAAIWADVLGAHAAIRNQVICFSP